MARSDAQLMLDVKAGDEQSFTLLLHRYRRPLVNFLYRMVRNREQAEDLAQEVFIRVYRAREDYVPSAKFTTWLFRIATNLALNSVRDNRYQRMEISLDAPVMTDAEDGDEKTLDVAEKHPTTCGACRVQANEFRAVNVLLDELPMIEPSAAFDVRMQARVAAEPAKQSWWAWFAPSPRVAFAASMLLLATVWVGSYSVSNPPQIDQADVPVLENYDVISSFEALTELSQAAPADDASQQNQDMEDAMKNWLQTGGWLT